MRFKEFWASSFSESWDTMWDLVIGESGLRLFFIIVITLLVIMVKDRRKEEPWKKGAIDALWSSGIIIVVFLIGVLVNAVLIEPPRMYSKISDSLTNATTVNADLLNVSNKQWVAGRSLSFPPKFGPLVK